MEGPDGAGSGGRLVSGRAVPPWITSLALLFQTLLGWSFGVSVLLSAGILLSVATAYLARSFNNIMDLLQLVFGFVNAPLFATFLLMSQAFGIAIASWTTCFVATLLVSLVTSPGTDDAMRGLVLGLTDHPRETEAAWWGRPATLAVVVVAMTVLLNLVFW